jgi:hypothetical protein
MRRGIRRRSNLATSTVPFPFSTLFLSHAAHHFSRARPLSLDGICCRIRRFPMPAMLCTAEVLLIVDAG